MWRPNYNTLRTVFGVVRLRPSLHKLVKLLLYPSSTLSTSQPLGANRVLYPKIRETCGIASFATWAQNEEIGEDSVTRLNGRLWRLDNTWRYNIILGAQICQPSAPPAKWREDVISRYREDKDSGMNFRHPWTLQRGTGHLIKCFFRIYTSRSSCITPLASTYIYNTHDQFTC